MIALHDFACAPTCPHAGQPWPAHLPKPTCRVIADLSGITNPVTIAVYRDILRRRMASVPKECEPEDLIPEARA